MLMKLYPEEMLMQCEKEHEFRRKTQSSCMLHTISHIRSYSGCIYSDHPGIRSVVPCLLGYQGIFQQIPPTPPALCAAPPPGGKGGKIRLQSSSKILLTQTHFLMLHEGGWQRGSLDWPDSGASQPPVLCTNSRQAAVTGSLSDGAIMDGLTQT